ncbi:MAG: hypothetical protein Q8M17_05690 [Actinomycetota bacterium]|nr:hypothetical protein [Actinomycetota bacterium]
METQESYRTSELLDLPGRGAQPAQPRLAGSPVAAWTGFLEAVVEYVDGVQAVRQARGARRLAVAPAPVDPVHAGRARLTVRSAGEHSAVPLALRMLPPIG